MLKQGGFLLEVCMGLHSPIKSLRHGGGLDRGFLSERPNHALFNLKKKPRNILKWEPADSHLCSAR
jgi:hypothetical protein